MTEDGAPSTDPSFIHLIKKLLFLYENRKFATVLATTISKSGRGTRSEHNPFREMNVEDVSVQMAVAVCQSGQRRLKIHNINKVSCCLQGISDV
jgi:hypothetical protein